jgi:hypothetical protein
MFCDTGRTSGPPEPHAIPEGVVAVLYYNKINTFLEPDRHHGSKTPERQHGRDHYG